MTTTYIVFAVVAVLVLWVISAYNGLITKKNRVDEAWSDIDVQLKRRHDLIPNVVETVKGYMSHEKEVFEKVTEARARALGATSEGERMQSENQLSQTLKTLFAVAENYPELKANANFLDLQRELADTENKLQASRRFYNGNARDYNIAVESFPYNIFAGMFHFEKRAFFEVAGEEKENVAVKF